MSTGTKVPHAQAEASARRFLRLFEGCYEAWLFAGSVRRHKPEVGDIEHVVKPLVLNGVNLLWQRMDELAPEGGGLFGAAAGPLKRARYGEAGTERWGYKYRGVMFEGVKHEVFTADADNFGCILAILTGPAEYSQMLVTELLKRGLYRQQDGYLRYQTGANKGAVRSVPNEEAFFELCGVPWVRPEERQ